MRRIDKIRTFSFGFRRPDAGRIPCRLTDNLLFFSWKILHFSSEASFYLIIAFFMYLTKKEGE